MENRSLPITTFEELPHETIGHDVLRYISLPSIFGEDKDKLLYYVGRNLARQIEIDTLDDLIFLFQKFQWGNLELIKDKRHKLTFYLMADEVAQRMISSLPVDFRLEAGFIAEAIEKITKRECECHETVNERLYRVQFQVMFTD